tara:strand:- start:12668 stop:13783 length:1116 start_codon:yes stop_codon:yes gene_type:complete
MSYIRTNVDFVNYVRDQADADIYLRLTDASTGSGRQFIIDLRGIPPFSDRRDTLVFESPNTATSDEERAELVRHIRIGLIPFVTGTSAMNSIDVVRNTMVDDTITEEPDDPWNRWVFETDLQASFDMEDTEFNYEIESGFNAERITEKWKYDIRMEYEVDRTKIDLSTGTRKVNRDSWYARSFIGYSLRDHLSIGLFTRANASRTQNILINLEASPAVEYSVFEYPEFQERRWVFQYRITPIYRNYDRTTVYLKDSEFLFQQVLSQELRYDQPWGRINVGISATSYLHDLSLNSLEFDPSLSIRITRGLFVNFYGNYRIINDQISLPAEDITDTERLLGERQQATTYELRFSFGVSYTFGSIYSNIVNPRF